MASPTVNYYTAVRAALLRYGLFSTYLVPGKAFFFRGYLPEYPSGPRTCIPSNSTQTPFFAAFFVVPPPRCCSAADRIKGEAVALCSLGALPWMLRHAGALRPAFPCARRAASRNRVLYPPTSFAPSPHSRAQRIPPSNTIVLSCCHLHHDARRKRDGRMPSMPSVIRQSRFNGKGSEGWERGILPSPVGAQRVSFSSEEGGAGAAKNKTEQSRMDEETRRSIGEGDEKAKKSVKTVKVSRV